MNPSIFKFDAKKFVGLKTSLRQTKNAPNNPASVPELWQKVMPATAGLSNRLGLQRYALITGDLPPHLQEEAFYYALVAVKTFDAVPESLLRIEIPERKAVKFTHFGLPQFVGKTTHKAVFEWLPQSKESLAVNEEIFVYPESYDRNNPEGHFDYYLFLK